MFDGDTICQWYSISTTEPKDHNEKKKLGVEKDNNSSLGKRGDIRAKETKPVTALPILDTNQIGSSLVSSRDLSVSTIGSKTSLTQTTTLSMPENITVPLDPPAISMSARNSSTPKIPEKKGLSMRNDEDGDYGFENTDFYQVEVGITCPDPNNIIDRWTPDVYRSRYVTRYADWQSEVSVSSREAVIEQLTQMMLDCQMCDCLLEEGSIDGSWALAPNRRNMNYPGNCPDQGAADWCNQVLGCYCERVAHLPTGGPPVYLLDRLGPGLYRAGGHRNLAQLESMRRFMRDREAARSGDTHGGDLPPTFESLEGIAPFPEEPATAERYLVPDPQEEEEPVVLQGPPPEPEPEVEPELEVEPPDYVDNEVVPGYAPRDPLRHRRPRVDHRFAGDLDAAPGPSRSDSVRLRDRFMRAFDRFNDAAIRNRWGAWTEGGMPFEVVPPRDFGPGGPGPSGSGSGSGGSFSGFRSGRGRGFKLKRRNEDAPIQETNNSI
ncbi:hypothetical protein TWF730_008451 [Orbilia blumenaviensis]|uniref:Uncharacterized protein n=1 Tax=Orbilia blumenaviensis TaxID=1796055 RepID=A0AAV9V920_9PEZI